MISHITVGVRGIARAKQFYDAVFAPLGMRLCMFEEHWVSWQQGEEDEAGPSFIALKPIDDGAPSAGNGSMIAFLAPDRPSVDACHAAAMAEGGMCEGPPGPRPQYHAHYYGAYFRDPDGNKLHVVCHKEETA